MIYKISSEEKLSQAGQKKQKSIGIYIFFTQTRLTVLNIKKMQKLSIKTFIKRKTRAGKAYAYQILVSLRSWQLLKI